METEFLPPEAADPLHVRLPVFDGPLDLLLHLVRKKQFDINELNVSELTEPYLETLRAMRDLNLDIAGEFLDIASTLIYIKSKSLLPKNPALAEEEDPEEQEQRLLLRLQEYQKIKDSAAELLSLDMLARDLFPRIPPPELKGEADGRELELEPASLFDLIEAFRGVMERARVPEAMNVVPEAESIDHRIDTLLNRFAEKQTLAFEELFDPDPRLAEVILVFMAILELVKLKALRVMQAVDSGRILCSVSEDFHQKSGAIRQMVLKELAGGDQTKEEPQKERR
ncbi:MAG: segregation/condensation protein A [Deltaproteobacteria bacterium]|nr:segregation/condensation protein A [Deltaproteobacteria bacterium]